VESEHESLWAAGSHRQRMVLDLPEMAVGTTLPIRSTPQARRAGVKSMNAPVLQLTS